MAQQKRGNAYYEGRLRSEHPAIYADWRAGKYVSPRQAFIAAGLKHEQSQLNALKAAWKKASAREQREFIAFVRDSVASSVKSTVTAPPSNSPATRSRPPRTIAGKSDLVAADGRLTTAARQRIRHLMAIRRMPMGEVMIELGCKKQDPSLGRALAKSRPTTVSESLATALLKWLNDNKHIA